MELSGIWDGRICRVRDPRITLCCIRLQIPVLTNSTNICDCVVDQYEHAVSGQRIMRQASRYRFESMSFGAQAIEGFSAYNDRPKPIFGIASIVGFRA